MKRKLASIGIATTLCLAAVLGCQSMYDNGGPGSGGGGFLDSGVTASPFFTAIQVDPKAEDSAGPQFIDVGDFDNDGLLDIASAWNQSQPIQIHMQRRLVTNRIVFATIPIGGTAPIARVSGLKVADLDEDGFDDLVVLVKDTGLVARCDESREDCDVTENGGILDNAVDGIIVLLFNPGDVYNQVWTSATLPQSNLAGKDEGGFLPELGGYTSLDVGDIDGTNGVDIVVALNRAEGDPATDAFINSVDFYPNPGGVGARNGVSWPRFPIHGDIPAVGACRISDVDDDGDNDVVVTFPTAKNGNVRWIPNPLNFGELGNVRGLWPPFAAIGQVATGAEAIAIGDIDGDEHDDVLVRSSGGKLIQWFKRPNSPSLTFIRNPWQVYSMAEFAERAPAAIALGDLNGDGLNDAALAAGGAVASFEPYVERSDNVFYFWRESLLINDDAGVSLSTDPNVDTETIGTLINTILIVDVDGDGHNDVLATLDRNAQSGLSNDALVLFRNTRGD